MKHIIITGGSGGIGGAVARRFQSYGWGVHLLLRSFDKDETQMIATLPNVVLYKADPSDKQQVLSALQMMKKNGIVPDFVFHSAGTFLWDNGKPKKDYSFEEVRHVLLRSNVETKTPTVNAIEEEYRDTLSSIEQGFVGSHAPNFLPEGPERKGFNGFKQEAYVESMLLVRSLTHRLDALGNYKKIFLFEPGFINTGLNEAFTEETIGYKVDWSTITTPDEYAITIFPKLFFEERK